MRYKELGIQTLHDFPARMQSEGFGWLVRAGYLNAQNEPLALGKRTIANLQAIAQQPDFLGRLALPVLGHGNETYFPLRTGSIEVMHCASCRYTARREIAQFQKIPLPPEDPLPLAKVLTPRCSTIEALAAFLNIPKEKTAKAVMFTRPADGRLIFCVLRGDMQLSERKLKELVGDFRPATEAEVAGVGAVPGYASPIGLRDALVVADDLIPQSANLVAGANETGFHLQNTNYGRDYAAQISADIALASAGDLCPQCGRPLEAQKAELLAANHEYRYPEILRALAEIHHDPQGLRLPQGAAPFDLYLLNVPGREIETRGPAEAIYEALQAANTAVLFDDRDERAGVKFYDADLIGCPLRLTVGEKNLKAGMVELKPRAAAENHLVSLTQLLKLRSRERLWQLAGLSIA